MRCRSPIVGPIVAYLLLGVVLIAAGPCDFEADRADLNRDGYVDLYDVFLVLGCVAPRSEAPAHCGSADVDGDGDVDRVDFVAVTRHLGEVLVDPDLPVSSPEAIQADGDGVLYLFAPDQDRILRWSMARRRPLRPLEIGAGAGHIAVSESTRRLYVAYGDGRITRFDLDFPVAEIEFATVEGDIRGLAAVGDLLFAAVFTGYRTSHDTFTPDGDVAFVAERRAASREFTWSPANERLYHFRDHLSPNDLAYTAIDPVTGAIGAERNSPYHGGLVLEPPIRVARDGSRVLLGTGDLYDGTTLEQLGALPFPLVDAAWREDGELLTLDVDDGAGSLLRRFDASDRLIEVDGFDGEPLRVLDTARGVAVVTQVGDRPVVYHHLPSRDGDGDHVPNAEDAFPIDPAVSVDSDGDGYPDAWNPGSGPEVSTTGLVLDAFPLDEACQLPEHGLPDQPDVCDLAHGVPDYEPLRIEVDDEGVVYLLSPENARIYRWSLVSDYHLEPIHIGEDAYQLAWSGENRRLYVGYDDGEIRQIDLDREDLREEPFVALDRRIWGLAAAGPFVFADTGDAKRTFAPDGALVSTADWTYDSEHYVFSAARARLYYSRFGYSQQLSYGELDPVSGMLGEDRWSSSTGAWIRDEAVRVASDGSLAARGGGVIHDASTLAVVDLLPTPFHEAQWLGDGRLLTIREIAPDQTALEQWDTRRRLVDVELYEGLPLRVVASAGEIAVITESGGQPRFASYVPTHDGDGDGVPSDLDAFPLDPAASVDSDGDGAPDAWNPGSGPEDSTTGLVIDAFPFDEACQLPEHGLPDRPEVCDLAHGIPAYEPAKIVAGGGVIYLLSPENERVYRWSLQEDYHVRPIDIGPGALSMAFSEAHGALYVSYESGAVTRIDPADPDLREEPFAQFPKRVWSLHPLDDRLLVAAAGSSYSELHLFAGDGTDLGFSALAWTSREFAWNPVLGRLYFFRDGLSPNDLLWREIDPDTGEGGAGGDSPYHGDYGVLPPIRVSPDGTLVLLGTGDFYDAVSLEVVERLGTWIADAAWLADGSLVTLRETEEGNTRLERMDPELRVLRRLDYPGAPLRLLETDDRLRVVTLEAGKPAFHPYVVSDDGDADGVPNAEDAFPLDPAASEDPDGDGSPNAWNPGNGEGDSTTGLTLDLFPDDRACWLAEHGLDGVCDFRFVIPPDAAEGLCDEDRVLPATDQGRLEVEATSDFVPLCSGWIVTANAFRDRIEIRNVVDGRTADQIALPSRPGDIELDAQRRVLHVALPEEDAIARIDLNDGSTEVLPMPGAPWSISLGDDGGLLVAVDRFYEGDLYWLPRDAASAEGGWPIGGRLIRWNPVYGELIAVRQGLSPVRMLRYGFEPSTGPVLLQTNFRVGGNAQDLTISPDGEHVALADGAGNIAGYAIADYVATDIESYRGEWYTGAYPNAVAFDSATERLLASDSDNPILFDVETFAELELWPISGCSYSRLDRVAFSRGNSIGLARQVCGAPRVRYARYHWFTLDGP